MDEVQQHILNMRHVAAVAAVANEALDVFREQGASRTPEVVCLAHMFAVTVDDYVLEWRSRGAARAAGKKWVKGEASLPAARGRPKQSHAHVLNFEAAQIWRGAIGVDPRRSHDSNTASEKAPLRLLLERALTLLADFHGCERHVVRAASEHFFRCAQQRMRQQARATQLRR